MSKPYNMVQTDKRIDTTINTRTCRAIASVNAYSPEAEREIDKLLGIGSATSTDEPDPDVLSQFNNAETDEEREPTPEDLEAVEREFYHAA
jgi:hypothetical protein